MYKSFAGTGAPPGLAAFRGTGLDCRDGSSTLGGRSVALACETLGPHLQIQVGHFSTATYFDSQIVIFFLMRHRRLKINTLIVKGIFKAVAGIGGAVNEE
jgi:hypothetical protein